MFEGLVGKLFEKAMGGDTIALIFSLKAFFQVRENSEVPPESRPHVVINLPGASPLSKYQPPLPRDVTNDG